MPEPEPEVADDVALPANLAEAIVALQEAEALKVVTRADFIRRAVRVAKLRAHIFTIQQLPREAAFSANDQAAPKVATLKAPELRAARLSKLHAAFPELAK
jgi:hypothetical protein